MTASKSERLMNLTILLLASRTYVTKERIRQSIDDYRSGSDDAFEKKFERDKEELRSMGVPIELGSADAYFDDEPGYRIRRNAFELPPLELEPDEGAVLGLAARVWQHAGLASATADALVKLKAAGVPVDREAIDAIQPSLVADEPAFEAMWEATVTRTPVRFEYRRPGEQAPSERHLQPWGVITTHGRWYVVGLDTDRGAPRVFRLSRIQAGVQPDGEAGAFTVPADTDLRTLTDSLVPPEPSGGVRVLVRSGAAHGLRRRGRLLETGVPGPDGTPGWDRLELEGPVADPLLGELLGFADDVLVEGPAEVRDQVVGRLRPMLGAAR